MSDRPSNTLGGFMFQKITRKVVDGVKETVKNETQKTTDEVKNDIFNVVKAAAPIVLGVVAIVAITVLVRRPMPAIKIIVKAV